jgi:hypothetical protein
MIKKIRLVETDCACIHRCSATGADQNADAGGAVVLGRGCPGGGVRPGLFGRDRCMGLQIYHTSGSVFTDFLWLASNSTPYVYEWGN